MMWLLEFAMETIWHSRCDTIKLLIPLITTYCRKQFTYNYELKLRVRAVERMLQKHLHTANIWRGKGLNNLASEYGAITNKLESVFLD